MEYTQVGLWYKKFNKKLSIYSKNGLYLCIIRIKLIVDG